MVDILATEGKYKPSDFSIQPENMVVKIVKDLSKTRERFAGITAVDCTGDYPLIKGIKKIVEDQFAHPQSLEAAIRAALHIYAPLPTPVSALPSRDDLHQTYEDVPQDYIVSSRPSKRFHAQTCNNVHYALQGTK